MRRRIADAALGQVRGLTAGPAQERRALVLDGHDATGKTTLAARLAAELGGVHVRPFARATGTRLLALAVEGYFDAALELAREAVERAAPEQPGRLCVFDRHWMTVLSLLPEERWGDWCSVPPTMLCWANLDTTLTRLKKRGEPQTGGEVREHLHYLDRYAALAGRFGCPVLRTDEISRDEALARLLDWAETAARCASSNWFLPEQGDPPRRRVPKRRCLD